MYVFLGMIFDGLVVLAWVFLIWGITKATQAGNPKRAKDRVFHVKTSWVLFFASILWLSVGTINIFVGEPFFGEFIFGIGFALSARTSNNIVRSLKVS